MYKVNSSDIKNAAFMAGGCVMAGIAVRVVDRLGERSHIPVAIFGGVFVAWMVFQIIRNRKRPLDPLRVKYGRLTLYGIMTMLVVQTIADRVVSEDVRRAIAVALLAVWFTVVNFLYRKHKETQRRLGP